MGITVRIHRSYRAVDAAKGSSIAVAREVIRVVCIRDTRVESSRLVLVFGRATIIRVRYA